MPISVYINQGVSSMVTATETSIQALDNRLTSAIDLETLRGIRTVSDYIGVGNSQDYYRFTLSSTSNLNLALSDLQANANVQLFRDTNSNGLLDASEVIQRSNQPGKADEAINIANLSAGVYFIQVSTEALEGTAYTLRLSDSNPSELLPVEIDLGVIKDSLSTTGTVGNDNSTNTYRFALDRSSAVNLTVSGHSTDVDLRLIYDFNNNGIVDEEEEVGRSQHLGTQPEILDLNSLGVGTYFIQIYQFNGNTDYRLALSTAPSDIDTAGNTTAAARDLGFLTTTQSINEFVGITDTLDYYRFTLTTASSVSLILDNLQADVDIELLQQTKTDNLSPELIAGSYNSDRQAERLDVGLKPGTYFVRVLPYRQSSKYTLNLSAVGLNLPPNYDLESGYGTVNAAAALARLTNRSVLPTANRPNNWALNAINAPEVWAQGYTGQGIVVAVVDSGVDDTHPDLDTNMWVNRAEIAGNGIDDDQNGFIDDVRGWDFVDQDNTPSDLNSHGTHIAGIIAAKLNDFGVTGVAPTAQIMPVRVLDRRNEGTDPDVANGIRYAANNGARVINLSLGGTYSLEVEEAVRYATSRGALVVMAAGNDGDRQPAFPSKLATQLGIAVGAIDSTQTLADFSNLAGFPIVNYLVAPGVDIYSTTPNNTYRTLSGTSMATPYVSGVAALMFSANPNLTPAQVVQLLTQTASSRPMSIPVNLTT
jgi:Subtilase family/Bacterial pre-peptidase C-terminal domain